MAKGKKTGGKDFKPGHGVGRPSHPPEVKKAAAIGKTEVIAKLTEFLKLSVDELQIIAKDYTRPSLDIWIARIVAMGLKTGDHVRLNFMFDRLIGKVTDKVEHTGALQPFVIEYSDGKRVEMGVKREDEK